MHEDSLLASRSEPNRKQPRRRPFLAMFLLTGLFAVGGLAAVMGVMFHLFLQNNRTILEATDDGWVAVPEGLPGAPNDMQTAADGSLWVRTAFRGSLSRLSDGKWDVYRGESFGTNSNYPAGGFALAGDQVWTCIDGQLLQSDAGEWRNEAALPGGFAAGNPVSVAADQRGAWLLDSQGGLWRYENGAWQFEDLSETMKSVRKTGRHGWTEAEFVVAPDGAQWLAAGQVWRREPNGKWIEERIDGTPLFDARIVGEERDGIWLAEGTNLAFAATDPAASRWFKGETLGLGPDAEISSVADGDDRTLAATTHGLLVLENGKWRPAETPQLANGGEVIGVVAGAGGQAWLLESAPIDGALAWIVMWTCWGGSLTLLAVVWMTLRPEVQTPFAMRFVWSGLGGVLLVDLFVLTATGMEIPAEFRPVYWPLMLCWVALPAPLVLVTSLWLGDVAAAGQERMVYEPVDDRELPKQVRRYFERWTPEIEALGFHQQGDLRLKRRSASYCRLFLSSDRQSFGEIVLQRGAFFSAVRACSFVSILESGDYLETGNLASKERNGDQFHTQCLPGASLPEVYAAHQRRLAELAEARNSHVVELRTEDFPVVSMYGLRMLYDEMVAEGLVAANIYEDAPVPELIGAGGE